jgi:hypothetical protein
LTTGHPERVAVTRPRLRDAVVRGVVLALASFAVVHGTAVVQSTTPPGWPLAVGIPLAAGVSYGLATYTDGDPLGTSL